MGNITIKPMFRVPITIDSIEQVKGNAIHMQNAGDTTITINDKWTLRPGGTLSFGSSDNVNLVIVENFTIKFSGAGTTNRLEIIETHVEPCL